MRIMKRAINKIGWMLAVALLIGSCGQVQDENQLKEDATAITENADPANQESIYLLTDEFTSQDNQTVHLEDFKGKPTVISMIFTSCGYACPRLTSDIQQIEKQLGDNADKVNFVLVTFDVERDTPEVLKEYAKKHGFDKKWTLLHADDDGVQTLSVLLNIPFEKDEEGDFSHGNVVSVLDENGVIQFQNEGLGNDPEPAVNAINKILKS